MTLLNFVVTLYMQTIINIVIVLIYFIGFAKTKFTFDLQYLREPFMHYHTIGSNDLSKINRILLSKLKKKKRFLRKILKSFLRHQIDCRKDGKEKKADKTAAISFIQLELLQCFA